ncbi:hypothetical protein RB195_020214 [Necator americanus]|uniref:F-box domain-containing protein n=1 Tax=Necator americanus TaxID=51031 RepID=A0ABR1CJB8_NECAM
MPVGLNDLPLELLVKITDYLSVECCLELAKVTERLSIAVGHSLSHTNCHIQGYWRRRDPKFEVIFERMGDEVVLARNTDELIEIFAIFRTLGHVSISLDIDDFAVDHLRTQGRLPTFSLSFLGKVITIKKLEWDCDVEVKLTDLPRGNSKLDRIIQDEETATNLLLEKMWNVRKILTQ